MVSFLFFAAIPANAQFTGRFGGPPAGRCTSKSCRCYLDLGALTRRLSAIYSVTIDANGKYYGDYNELRVAEISADNINGVYTRTLKSCKEAGLEKWVPYVWPKMNNMKFLAR